jgi:hypothetical protein
MIMKMTTMNNAKFKLSLIAAVGCLVTTGVSAQSLNSMADNMSQHLSCYTLDCGHFYVGANVGGSHLHDHPNPGSNNSVNENGPGGSVVAGYQFNSIAGVEAGFTKYSDSREQFGTTILAKTQHYSVDVAGTGRYPLIDALSAIGKLGVAYSYAQKMAVASGVAQSSGAVSAYWGLGLDYSVTPRVDFLAQFAEAVGNHLTGSADLWSVGVNFAIV